MANLPTKIIPTKIIHTKIIHTKIIHTKIRWLIITGELPTDIRIPTPWNENDAWVKPSEVQNLKRQHRAWRRTSSTKHRKWTNGISTNGVTADFMFFDRGSFWVLPLI